MKNPNISIIVPVYNVENYISKCLESIVAQTYTDYDVVIVDDASTDNTAQIIIDFIKKNNLDNFNFFSKPKSGVASTRNFSLNKAKGDWIAFVDGDDWVDPQYLEVMWSAIKKYDADLCYTGARAYDEEAKCFLDWVSYAEQYGTLPENLDYLYSYSTLWAHLYKNEIIKKHGISFDENVYCEDSAFDLDYNSVISSFCATDDVVYNYRINRAGQLTSTLVSPLQKARMFNHMQKFLSSFSTEDVINAIPKNQRLTRVMWNELYSSVSSDILKKRYTEVKARRKAHITKIILKSYKPRSKKEKIMRFCLKRSYLLLCIFVKAYYSRYEKIRKTKLIGYFSK